MLEDEYEVEVVWSGGALVDNMETAMICLWNGTKQR